MAKNTTTSDLTDGKKEALEAVARKEEVMATAGLLSEERLK